MSDLMVIALGALIAIGPTNAEAQDQPTQQPAAQPAQQPAREGAAFSDPLTRMSYAFGLYLGRTFKLQTEQFQLEPRAVTRGIVDGLNDSEPLLSDEQMAEVMEELEQQIVARQEEAEKAMLDQMQEQAEANKTAGEDFRSEFAQRDGVRRTNSGLLYESMKSGEGAKPTLTDTVTIHYKGTLLDGTVFDTTEDKGPMTFPVSEFIEGWKQALQLMNVGDKWRVVIPPELAYGEFGTPGGPIPPNATLVFEIELLGISGE